MKGRNIRRKLIGVLLTAVLLAGIGITASASDLDQAKAQDQLDSSVTATQSAVEIRYASDTSVVESTASDTEQPLVITVLDDETATTAQVAAADSDAMLADEEVPLAAAPAEISAISYVPLYGAATAVIVVLVIGVVIYVRTTREKAEYVEKRENIRRH